MKPTVWLCLHSRAIQIFNYEYHNMTIPQGLPEATSRKRGYMNIKITQDIPLSRISDLLTCALEGGSNYWYMIEEKTKPIGWTYLDEMRPSRKNGYWIHEYALNEGGELLIESMEEEEDEQGGKKLYRLNLKTIKSGLQTMADKYPSNFSDFMAENEDSITGDIFLQCCLFNDVIYG